MNTIRSEPCIYYTYDKTLWGISPQKSGQQNKLGIVDRMRTKVALFSFSLFGFDVVNIRRPTRSWSEWVTHTGIPFIPLPISIGTVLYFYVCDVVCTVLDINTLYYLLYFLTTTKRKSGQQILRCLWGLKWEVSLPNSLFVCRWSLLPLAQPPSSQLYFAAHNNSPLYKIELGCGESKASNLRWSIFSLKEKEIGKGRRKERKKASTVDTSVESSTCTT